MTLFVCPWWGGYFIDNALRRWLHPPETILGPYVKPGMTVADVGCGMGFFTIPMARMVGESGRVIAADLQPQMLSTLQRRARSAGVERRITLHQCEANALGLSEKVDFVLAFAMVHEVPDRSRLLREIVGLLRPGAKVFIAEPRIHVPASNFQRTLRAASECGLQVLAEPSVRWCRAVVVGLPE
jgi:FkbM family methyltransferase